MRDDDGSRTTVRGQSSIDFLIGFGIFFLVFSFVITLIPDLLSPFAAQEGPAVANRAADTLAGDLLATGTVGSLNAACTAEFFDTPGSSGCTSFDGNSSSSTLLGLSEEYRLNVTLERNVTADPGTEVFCYDGTDALACSDGGTPLARGDPPPGDTQSVRSARRVVELDDRTLLLKLRVW